MRKDYNGVIMKKAILLFAIVSWPSFAMQRVQGFCEQGGKVVVTSGLNSTTKVQGSYPLCTVTIYPTGSNTPVPGNSIFSNNGSTVLGNPFTADANGHWFFYAANGRYDIKLSGTIATWTIGDVLLADPAGFSSSVTSVSAGAGISVSNGTSAAVVTNENPSIFSVDYNFAPQTPGGTISAGSNTIPLSPVPPGVNASNPYYWVYISGGAGTAEACLVTGGTAVAGATSGTLIATCANSHSGAWTVSSVMSGIPEALNSSVTPHIVLTPAGTIQVYGPVMVRGGWGVVGQGNGDGPYAPTILNVATTFPITIGAVPVKGVFVGDGTIAQKFSDFQIAFTQPDSAHIADYTHWPPAFYLVDNPAFVIARVHLLKAWDAIKMTGNSGGAHITDFQASIFNVGIDIDGSLDSIYLTLVRFWPHGLTATQMGVMNNTESIIALKVARTDDLHVIDFWGDCRKVVYLYQSALGTPSVAKFSNVSTDAGGRIIIEAGQSMWENVWLSQVPGLRTAFAVSGVGTNVQVSNLFIWPGTPTTGNLPLISLSDGTLQLINGWFWTASADSPTILQNSGVLLASNNYFLRSYNVAYTYPTISIAGGRATLIGNRTYDKGTGAGTFISIANDDWHQIRGNTFVGWASAYPAVKASSWYEDDYVSSIPTLGLHGINLGSLGTPTDGTVAYCANCMVTSDSNNTCTSGGTGALAARINGVWRCFIAQN